MIDRRHLGRRYGPYRYLVGLEEVRDFATVLAGGVPGRAFTGAAPSLHPAYQEGAAAPPTFCVRFAIQPFTAACSDPELRIDLVKLLHGEQAFELAEPVRPGDAIETVGEIVDLREKGGMDFMTVRTTSTNQHGRVVVVGRWTAVVRP